MKSSSSKRKNFSSMYSKEIIRNFFRLVLHFNSPDVINVIGKCYSYNEKETKGGEKGGEKKEEEMKKRFHREEKIGACETFRKKKRDLKYSWTAF